MSPVRASNRSGRLRVRVQRLPHARDLPLPRYESEHAAGLDVIAAVPADAPIRLQPGQRALVPTGLVLELPPGHEAQVRPRSGLALRHGITVLNSPGTIDCDYRGELMILLINLGEAAWEIQRGERIAQLVLSRVEIAEFVAVEDVSPTARGAGGFGSTGQAATRRARRSARKLAGT